MSQCSNSYSWTFFVQKYTTATAKISRLRLLNVEHGEALSPLWLESACNNVILSGIVPSGSGVITSTCVHIFYKASINKPAIYNYSR